MTAILLLTALLAQDTLTLSHAHAAAMQHDPRMAQPALAAAATDSRIAGLLLERKPQFAVRAEATHQSDVTSVPLALPTGAPPQPPKDRFQATLSVEQLLYDAGIRTNRIAAEQARLAETDASQTSARYARRGEVDQAFFTGYLMQMQAADLALVVTDLAGRLAAARARVREGTALSRDTAAIEAERLTALRRRDDALSERTAAIDLLRQLTGLDLGDATVLILPVLDPQIAALSAQALRDSLRARPEFRQLLKSQQRLDAEIALAGAINRPRVTAFGQAGVGRPGLNQFDRDPASFWTAGVRLEWRPWTWHSADLSSEALRAQRRSIDYDAEALADQLARAASSDLARITRLRDAVEIDTRISALRGVVEATARVQFDEGVMTTADYLTARTALLEARLAEERDRAEQVRLQAMLLTTLGLSLREPGH